MGAAPPMPQGIPMTMGTRTLELGDKERGSD